jgi:glycosyltransferase involved in cell wall biosynthesis
MSFSGKLKILLINAYDMDKVYKMYHNGQFPGHHLFGALQLKNNYNMDIIIPKQEKYPFLNKIGNLFDVALLDQQIRAMFTLRKCDILYAPYAAGNTKLIIVCKWLGLVRKPIVILVHQPLFGKPSKRKWVRFLVKKLILKYDTIIFFSHKMMVEMIEAYDIDEAYAKEHFRVSYIGVDKEYFSRYTGTNEPEKKNFLMSSGNSGRDFDILIRAAQKVDFPFKIYCRPESYPKQKPVPKNVEILSGDFPFGQICQDYADARIVLIPLASKPKGTAGIISLLDAMAMGKPVIITRNKNLDVDFQHEKEKIGMEVDESDTDGWVNAITVMLNDYQSLKNMGDRSMELGKKKFHVDTFVEQLAQALEYTHRRYLKKN